MLLFRFSDGVKIKQTQFDEISSTNNLENPGNLTRSMEPITLQADNYMNGFEQVFDILSKRNYCTAQALIVIPWTESYPVTESVSRCECYRNGSIQEFENHVSGIYHCSRRQLPTVYLDEIHADAAKNWVVSRPKPNDIITDYISVGGFEHPIVVIFNPDGHFEHSLAMRSTGMAYGPL